ncbi:hypothetical protein SK128_000288 [Halocaridina rubra]|uniref:Uncharacterized protein n=1 Tax=Halocaridina rubra TaxID=373956 RepID=A0AAN8ZYM9_HALRR
MVTEKISAFQSNYRRELKKVLASEKSEAGIKDIYRSSLWYYNSLEFLRDQEVQQEGISSMDNEEEGNNHDTLLDDPVLLPVEEAVCQIPSLLLNMPVFVFCAGSYVDNREPTLLLKLWLDIH